MLSPITNKIIKKFHKTNLSLEDRVALTNTILSTLLVLPIDNAIEILPGEVKIRGRKLTTEDFVSFTESCKALRDNKARQVINEQVKFLAINMGVHQSVSLETIMFSKAALWVIQQENELLDKIV
jgi:hypothetical protein